MFPRFIVSGTLSFVVSFYCYARCQKLKVHCDPRTGCFRGILKSCFKWNDTLECFKGSSEVGANQCYLEYHVAIDQYKERGINVATYNDSSSNTVYLEYICLVLLLVLER